jgi:hypothetical protein
MIELPEAIADIYDAWHEQHQKDGHIPSRAECGEGPDGKPLWCDLKEGSHATLQQALRYQAQEAQDKLARYRQRPTGRLAREVARHLVLTDVLRQLLEWDHTPEGRNIVEHIPPRKQEGKEPTSDTNPVPEWLRGAWPGIEKTWRKWFAKCYRDYFEGATRAEVAGAWGRFRAECLAKILAEHPPCPGQRAYAEAWCQRTFVWVLAEKIDAERLAQGKEVSLLEPGPDGKLQQWRIARDALGKPPRKPDGKPTDN